MTSLQAPLAVRRPVVGSRAGLTLIELMMAMAISLLVLLAAFTAFDTGMNALARAQKLAQENQALRIGLVVALDELDFWTLQDQPQPGSDFLVAENLEFDAAQDELVYRRRMADQINRPAAAASGQGPFAELTIPDFATWRVHERRTWYPGILYGDACDRSHERGFPYDELFGSGAPGAPPEATYVAAVLDQLWTRGGLFALAELMPAGSLYYFDRFRAASAYDDGSDPVYPGLFDRRDGGPREPGQRFYKDGYAEQLPVSMSRLQQRWHGMPIGIGNGATSAQAYARGLDWFGHGSSGFIAEVADAGGGDIEDQYRYANALARAEALVTPTRPRNWPELRVAVRRMWHQQQPLNYCNVRVFYPEEMEELSLHFHAMGTTLRGARQQRAAWDSSDELDKNF
jgi:prepilin-type N-terminal cleavage/methylation domain-containing protein